MTSTETTALPPPRTVGAMSLEETLQKRRSVRDFHQTPISLADVSQLLWAAQGYARRGSKDCAIGRRSLSARALCISRKCA